MNFDRMGRRTFYKEEVNGVVTKHHKFVYDNYLCVQNVDALNNNAQINLFVWDIGGDGQVCRRRPLQIVYDSFCKLLLEGKTF